MTKRIKLMVLLEAQTVTGPAKSFMEFAKTALNEEGDLPGVDVMVVTFQRSGAKEDFIHAVKESGLAISVIPEKRAFDPGILRPLRALVKEWSPDIIQTTSIKSHFLVKWLGLYQSIPWVAFHHGYTTTDMKMLLYNQLDRYSLRSAQHVFTVCQAFRRDLTSMGVEPQKISVHHNMIAPFERPVSSKIEALRVSLGLAAGVQGVLCVGRLSREKGHKDLIQAVAILHRESPELNFRLVLLGDGPERESIRRLSQELKVVDLIIFAGHQRDTSTYYALADVFVLASHSEGSPVALLEAMAAGVPSVATSVGGVPEMGINEKNALLVPKGDCDRMAKAIRRLLTDHSLREKLIMNGPQVTKRYSHATYRDEIVQIYQTLLGCTDL